MTQIHLALTLEEVEAIQNMIRNLEIPTKLIAIIQKSPEAGAQYLAIHNRQVAIICQMFTDLTKKD
jgi:hypothetical protein